ncbi:hypothetical protein WMY93_021436 [Mugilogobius chulae]|uniref:Uncharacterized protein n=1 Tax=Mugilogobius chulae TaxID=88201 RepID=A0AAW0NN49_9GOBI
MLRVAVKKHSWHPCSLCEGMEGVRGVSGGAEGVWSGFSGAFSRAQADQSAACQNQLSPATPHRRAFSCLAGGGTTGRRKGEEKGWKGRRGGEEREFEERSGK